MKKLPPIVPPMPQPEPFPYEVCGVLGVAAKACADVTEAPIEMAISTALATAAACVQRLNDVELRHGVSAPTSLYMATIGQSGERKSAVNKMMMKPLLDTIENQLIEYDQLMRAYNFDLNHYESEQKRVEKKAITDFANSRSVALSMDQPREPINPQMMINDFTQEGLMRALLQTPAILLSEDEGGSFVGGHSWGENKVKVMTFLSSLWGGEARHVARALDGRSSNSNRRASLNLMFQPKLSSQLVRDGEALDQGFLARILISHPPSRIGTRTKSRNELFVQNVQCADGPLGKWRQSINELASIKPRYRDSDNGIENTVLTFDPEAWVLLEEYYRETEEGQISDGKYSGVRSFASKTLEQACRIAAVLQKVDDPMADTIDLDHAKSGTAVSEWFLNEMMRITSHSTDQSPEYKAQLLLDLLTDEFGREGFKPQDIYHGKGRNKGLELRDSKSTRNTLRLLEQLGYVVENGDEWHVSAAYSGLHTAQTAQTDAYEPRVLPTASLHG